MKRLRRPSLAGRDLRRANKTKIFVISAPSGGGKTTLCKRLLDDGMPLALSVSMTTRPPRPGEMDGRDYRFTEEQKFRGMIRRKELLEYEGNFGYLYGTPKDFVERNLKKGQAVLLSIDVKGAMKIRRAYPANSVLIFILPPSISALEKRLSGRHSESPLAITRRIARAKKEMGYKNKYDYRIVNDRLESAYERLKDVIISELENQ